jgi:hypothetical protein
MPQDSAKVTNMIATKKRLLTPAAAQPMVFVSAPNSCASDRLVTNTMAPITAARKRESEKWQVSFKKISVVQGLPTDAEQQEGGKTGPAILLHADQTLRRKKPG